MLDSIPTWLVACGAGILFGFFPSLWQWSATIINAVRWERKKVPNLMMSIAEVSPGISIFHELLLNKRYYLNILRITALVWIIICTGGTSYNLVVNMERSRILEDIVIEISFILFLLMTWLLPSYFLKRYLRRLKPVDNINMEMDTKINKASLKKRRESIIFTIILTAILGYVIFVMGLASQLLFWIAVLIEIFLVY